MGFPCFLCYITSVLNYICLFFSSFINSSWKCTILSWGWLTGPKMLILMVNVLCRTCNLVHISDRYIKCLLKSWWKDLIKNIFVRLNFWIKFNVRFDWSLEWRIKKSMTYHLLQGYCPLQLTWTMLCACLQIQLLFPTWA